MADNIAITAGAGTTIKTDEGGATGAHMQVVKLAYSANGDETLITADASGLEVQIGASVDLTVQPKAATAFPVTDNGGNLSVDDGAGSLTVDAPVAAPVAVRLSSGAAFVDAIPVTDNSTTLSVDDGGSTLSVDGTVTANQGTSNTLTNAWGVKVSDGTDSVGISTVGAVKALKVDVVQSSVEQADKSAFTEGTTLCTPVAGVYNDTISADPTEDQAAALRLTVKRGLHVNLRNVAGTEIGTAADPVEVGLRNSGGTELSTQAAPVLVAQAYGNQTRVTTSLSLAASGTAVTFWDPAGGKKFVVTDIFLALSVGGALTVFDGTDAPGNYVLNGTMPVGFWHMPLARPWISSTADNILKTTTGTGITGNMTVHGYEV